MIEDTEKEGEYTNQELLNKGEISLILDTYDDIFSDFDPRPFSERSLSVDFLDEARRATREKKPGTFEIKFLMPHEKRKLEKESIIKKRLRDHFKKHYEMIKRDRISTIKQGALFVFLGVLFMFLATYILLSATSKNFLFQFLIVLLEPGGWFLLWEGLNILVFDTKKLRPEIEFYKKMSKTEISFTHY